MKRNCAINKIKLFLISLFMLIAINVVNAQINMGEEEENDNNTIQFKSKELSYQSPPNPFIGNTLQFPNNMNATTVEPELPPGFGDAAIPVNKEWYLLLIAGISIACHRIIKSKNHV